MMYILAALSCPLLACLGIIEKLMGTDKSQLKAAEEYLLPR